MLEQFGAPEWADRPDSRPPGYEYLVRSGWTGRNINPWMLLTLDEAADVTNEVAELFPSRKLVAFALRTERFDVACWDAESTDHRIYSIASYDSGEKWASMQTHNSLSNWMRAVLELHQGDGMEDWYWTLKPGQRPEDLDEQHDELRQNLGESAFAFFEHSEAPQWLQNLIYDPYYQFLEYDGLTHCDLPPWRFLSEVEITRTSATLHKIFPDRRFVAYARRSDTAALACWDASRRDYTIYVLDQWWQRENTCGVATYPELYAWHRHALEDFIQAGPQASYWRKSDGYVPLEE